MVLFGGPGSIVEADETYHGGVRRSGKGVRTKTPILGVVERSGEVRSLVSDVASTSRAKRFLTATVKANTILHTDESRIYIWADKPYARKTVNHSLGEYSKDGVTTNTIESFWSQLKRSIDGTYHCVSPKYLQSYVNEFVFRYNLRGVVVYPVLLERAARRVGGGV